MAEQNEVKFEEIKKPKMTAMNLGMVLGAKYFSERSTERLHSGLLNVYHQILFDGDHYCTCDKYDGCRDEFSDRRYCPICRFKYCGEFNDFKKRCHDAQFKFDELLKIASELFFYPEEMFEVVDNVHELFGGQYSAYFRNREGCKIETSMEDLIKSTTYKKITNGEEKYLNFFY